MPTFHAYAWGPRYSGLCVVLMFRSTSVPSVVSAKTWWSLCPGSGSDVRCRLFASLLKNEVGGGAARAPHSTAMTLVFAASEIGDV